MQNSELAVLSTMAQGGNPIIGVVAPLLEVSDFTDEVHGFLFERMVSRWTNGEAIDRITLADDLNQVAIQSPLVEALFTERVDVTHIEAYANNVYRDAVLRQIQNAAQVQGQYARESGDYKGVLAASQALLDSVAERESSRETGDLVQILSNANAAIAERATANRPLGFISGLPQYDELFGGLRKKHIHYVSAYTSVGKSWWAVKAAIGFLQDGANVNIYSLEMSSEQWAMRLLACITGIDSRRIEIGRFIMPGEKEAYDEAVEWLSAQPIKIFSYERRAKGIGRLIRFNRPDIAIVDYIQKVQGEHGESRYESLTKASNDLSMFAAKNNCGLMVISSVSNEAVFGKDKGSVEPRLKGSGDLAYDADGVIDLKRDKDATPNLLDVKFSKNRHGPTGWAQYEFDVRCGGFRELNGGL